MADDRVAEQLRGYVAGDVSLRRYLLGLPQATLAEAAVGHPLDVDAAGVLRMLESLSAGRIILSEAQEWASFVRAGGFPSPRPPVAPPLAVGFRGTGEEEMRRIVARFDEMGDLSDEPLGDRELAGMIESMRAAAQAAR